MEEKNIRKNTEKRIGEKLTYEQLNNACDQLYMQNKQLVIRNRELEQFAMNKRLECLFNVLKYSNNFSSDFVVNCSSEIEEALTIPQWKMDSEDNESDDDRRSVEKQ